MAGLQQLESKWILILETTCSGGDDEEEQEISNDNVHAPGGFASSSDGALPSSSTQSVRRNIQNWWQAHQEKAFLQCDIALFPEDLSLSRADFLASVLRLPRQVLKPCGTENLFLFPPLRASRYHLSLSACQMQGTLDFVDTLPLTVPNGQAVVVWNASAQDVRKEPTLAHSTATLHLDKARDVFHWQKESQMLLEQHAAAGGGDTTVASHDLTRPGADESAASAGVGNRTEILALLQTLQSKMENDIHVVDQVLVFLAIAGFVTIICLVKLVFCESPPVTRKRRPAEVRFQDTPVARSPPASHWRVPREDGVGRGTLTFRTPPPVPLSQGTPSSSSLYNTSTGRRPPVTTLDDDSPCRALVSDWEQRRDERRRHRTPLSALAGRRLIAPPDLQEEKDKVAATPREEGAQKTVPNTVAVTPLLPPNDPSSASVRQSENQKDLHERSTPRLVLPSVPEKDDAPEELARHLWGFGM